MDTDTFPAVGGATDLMVDLVKARRHLVEALAIIEQAQRTPQKQAAMARCNINSVRNLIACLDNKIDTLMAGRQDLETMGDDGLEPPTPSV